MKRFFLVSLSVSLVVVLTACQKSNQEPMRTPVANYSHINGGNNGAGGMPQSGMQQAPAGNQTMQPYNMPQSPRGMGQTTSTSQPSPMGMKPPSSIKEMESRPAINPMDEVPENPTYQNHGSVFAFPNPFKKKEAPKLQKRRATAHPEYVKPAPQPVVPEVIETKKSDDISSDAEKYQPVKPKSLAPIKSNADLEKERMQAERELQKKEQLAKQKLERDRKLARIEAQKKEELAKKEMAKRERARKNREIKLAKEQDLARKKELKKQKERERKALNTRTLQNKRDLERKKLVRKELAKKEVEKEMLREEALLKQRKNSNINAIYQEEKLANEEIKRINTDLSEEAPLDEVDVSNNEVASSGEEIEFNRKSSVSTVRKSERRTYINSSRYSDRSNSLSRMKRH